jgi:hypothetical protein
LKSRNVPRQALATGLAACAHLLVLLLMGWKVPRLALVGPAEERSGAISITLFRPAARPRPRSRTPATPASPSRARAAPGVLTAPTPGAPTPGAPTPGAPTPGAPIPVAPPPQAPTAEQAQPDIAADRDRERLGSVLRGLTGCADPSSYRLSREERAACDRRLAAAPPAPVQRQFDPKEVEQFNSDRQESIFTRKPHNGCLPGIGDRPAAAAGVQAKSGATTTFGPRCRWSFW